MWRRSGYILVVTGSRLYHVPVTLRVTVALPVAHAFVTVTLPFGWLFTDPADVTLPVHCLVVPVADDFVWLRLVTLVDWTLLPCCGCLFIYPRFTVVAPVGPATTVPFTALFDLVWPAHVVALRLPRGVDVTPHITTLPGYDLLPVTLIPGFCSTDLYTAFWLPIYDSCSLLPLVGRCPTVAEQLLDRLVPVDLLFPHLPVDYTRCYTLVRLADRRLTDTRYVGFGFIAFGRVRVTTPFVTLDYPFLNSGAALLTGYGQLPRYRPPNTVRCGQLFALRPIAPLVGCWLIYTVGYTNSRLDSGRQPFA